MPFNNIPPKVGYDDVGYRRDPGHNESNRKGAAQRRGSNNGAGSTPDANDRALSSIINPGRPSVPTPGGDA